MKNLILVTLLLSVGYSQCNESNWHEYYPNMDGCNLYEANLYGADLSGANLSWADLTYANLSEANLSEANLSWAYLFGANLGGACLEGAVGFTQTSYDGTPILEGCASGDGDCSFEDTDEDGYDDASYNAGLGDCSYEDLDNDGYDDSSYDGGMLAFDTNSDGIADNRPILRILGEDSMMMVADCNANYIDDGATCDDMTDGNISQSVEVSGDVVNMCIPDDVGSMTYSIHYSCTNSQGFTATDTRQITIYHSYEQGLIDGAQSGDINGDGVLNVIDLVMFVDIIIGR